MADASQHTDTRAEVTIDEIELADEPRRWRELGLDVRDGVRLLGRGDAAGRGITGWSLRGISSTDLDGLPTRRSDSALGEPAGEHPNGVLAIDHVVVFSPDLDRTMAALQAAGLDLRRV